MRTCTKVLIQTSTNHVPILSYTRPPLGVSQWPDGELLAGQSPLGVSHWLSPSDLRPRVSAVLPFDCWLFHPKSTTPVPSSPTSKPHCEGSAHPHDHKKSYLGQNFNQPFKQVITIGVTIVIGK